MNIAVKRARNNAFPHRDSSLPVSNTIAFGEDAHRRAAYNWMSNHFRPCATGVYVNYEEDELENYWGKSLRRLKRLKSMYVSDLFFDNPQPIPATEKDAEPSCSSGLKQPGNNTLGG